MTDPGHTPTEDLLGHVREHRGRFRWLGIALIVAGIAAILFPFVASIAAKVMVGWLLLITGGVTLWHAFQSRSWREALLSGLVGLLNLAAGGYLAFFPLTGLVALTLLLGLLFGLQGGVEVAMAWRHRPGQNWGWMMASGIAAIALALLLLLGLPGTALWALGLFLGINFISSGAAFLALSRID
ncbi:HdeD family acid-resistance protein [Histidinibacterium aquaticum]|uniref:HdeD family acid-resistance protein n=1 Tax=Histidinibacterium aquaticum TaxID=2613962 RepID=A0A5J5GIR9_9RHOB|nr:DUF308 domain-containing protein [Histidinibacterium aquaticum]KAA9008017.1 HdeD family acid-resistance protein [Histidinibacterium aquaticum]